MKRIGVLFPLGAAAIGLLVSALVAPASAAWEPKGQAECIAPANPGGGFDAICRSTSAVLQKTGLVKSNIYVTNMPGGSGVVAIANVLTKRKADTNLLVAASPALTFAMALKRTPHTYDDVIPLAQIGAEIGGFFVKADSKYKSLADLIKALKADPRSVTFAGGSAPGGLDHIKAALLAKAIGVDPTKLIYTPFQGGGEALTSMLGGHTEVAALDVSEAAGQLEAKAIRCLGLLSDKRSAKFKDIPTTHEQGVKASFIIWRGLYMPPGVPAEAVKFWSDAIQKMVATPDWDKEREKMGWEPTFKFGAEFTKFTKDEYASLQVLLKELGFLK
jgi:putative tricarboxylic transport membrane protein